MDIKYLDLHRVNLAYMREVERLLARTLHSGRYLLGEQTERFESEFAVFCGAKHAVGVANGLDALTLILSAYKSLCGWADGDEVIVPAHTFIASIEAITRAGLQPVLCDVKAADFLMDDSLVEELVSPRTRALMPVHLYGRVCQMDKLQSLAERYGLKIVEDAAQAHGAWDESGTRRAGNLGDAAGFSFYPTKNLGALGDAGAVVTNDKRLAEQVRIMANYGMRKRYYYTCEGINSRMDELQAALLRVKLRSLDADNAVRQTIAREYDQKIVNDQVHLPYAGLKETRLSVYHVYPVLCRRRDELQAYLASKGIQTNIHYPVPPHRQPAYAWLQHGPLPVTERICREEFSLPLHQALSKAKQKQIIHFINQFL